MANHVSYRLVVLFCYDPPAELWKYELPMAVTVADFGSGITYMLT